MAAGARARTGEIIWGLAADVVGVSDRRMCQRRLRAISFRRLRRPCGFVWRRGNGRAGGRMYGRSVAVTVVVRAHVVIG